MAHKQHTSMTQIEQNKTPKIRIVTWYQDTQQTITAHSTGTTMKKVLVLMSEYWYTEH